MAPVTDVIEIVAFGLIFVFTAALANGLSVHPAPTQGAFPVERPPGHFRAWAEVLQAPEVEATVGADQRAPVTQPKGAEA